MSDTPPGRRGRPYRSHLQPACFACKKRKSRCKLDRGSESCLMCRIHGNQCEFPSPGKMKPTSPETIGQPASYQSVDQPAMAQTAGTRDNSLHLGEAFNFADIRRANNIGRQYASPSTHASNSVENTILLDTARISSSAEPISLPLGTTSIDGEPRTINLATDLETESSHIVGPAIANDAQVLGRYLSSLPSTSLTTQTIRSFPNTMAFKSIRKPVLFTSVQKKPVGMSNTKSQGAYHYQIIEKLIEPCSHDLIDIYFKKTNICFPILDEAMFKKQYHEQKDRISPAFLSCLYANTMIYWGHNSEGRLRAHRRPDVRFIWVQALEALFSDLLLSPDISTIISVLLNVTGRPTTTMTGNSMTLASAIALSQSLGLNRDPSEWDISDAEKSMRIRVWWALLINDRWCSLAYGTPPLIQDAQYDVPLPRREHFHIPEDDNSVLMATEIFISLCSLTEVLASCLSLVYDVKSQSHTHDGADRQLRLLELQLGRWEEGLSDELRRIVIRGSNLSSPGSANLRLAYLSTRLVIERIALDQDYQYDMDIHEETMLHRRLRAQRAAENIVHFIQDLGEEQLADFWLPAAAFILASTTTLLLRCALEGTTRPLAQNTAVKRANDLLTALHLHKERHGWDLGDICIAQCGDVVLGLQQLDEHASVQDMEHMIMNDIPFVDDLFPTLWDMFETP